MMNEKEVLLRLGLKDKKELADLLGISEDEIGKFDSKQYYFPLELKNYLSRLTYVGYRFEKNYLEWVVSLKKDNSQNIPMINDTIAKKDVPAGFPNDEINDGSIFGTYYFHRGHLVPEMYRTYIPFKNFNSKTNNLQNIVTLFKDANGNHIKGQGYFEHKIEKLIEEGSEILYRVRAVFLDEMEKTYPEQIPIGIELFWEYISKSKSSNSEEPPNHVFIPNYDIDFNLDTIEQHKEFYREGYNELKHMNSFNHPSGDSDRPASKARFLTLD